MTTIYDEIKSKLELYPLARERSNKNKLIATMLLKKYDSRMQTSVDATVMESIVRDSSSYDRAWRQVLQREPHLRGTDYGDKDELEGVI